MTIPIILHLWALTILAAGVIGGWVVHFALLRALKNDPSRSLPFAMLLQPFGATAALGSILMLLTGLGLMHSRGWLDWGHAWLSVKLTLYVIVFASGFLVARPTAIRLGALIGVGAPAADMQPIISRLTIVHVINTVIFATIIALGVWGPRQY